MFIFWLTYFFFNNHCWKKVFIIKIIVLDRPFLTYRKAPTFPFDILKLLFQPMQPRGAKRFIRTRSTSKLLNTCHNIFKIATHFWDSRRRGTDFWRNVYLHMYIYIYICMLRQSTKMMVMLTEMT